MKAPPPAKTVFLIRHGESMHNAHSLLSVGADLNDMGYVDAPLTPEGVEQAKALQSTIPSLRAELIVTSPLTRATETCLHATSGLSPSVPTVVNHLCRERLAYSCDIGSNVTTLMTKFPDMDYGSIPNIWWWTPPDGSAKTSMESLQILRSRPPGAHKQEWFKAVEPMKAFQKRVDEFRLWLLERPERRIAVFAHGVFNVKLIGDNSRMGNCEVRKLIL